MMLHFEPGSMTDDRAMAGFDAIHRALGGTSALEQVARTSLPDQNCGPPRAFAARFEAPDAMLTVRVENGSGDPREGWGYLVSMRYERGRPGGPALVVLSAGGWEPFPNTFPVELAGVSSGELETIRSALRALFGEASDRSGQPYVALSNVRAFEAAGDAPAARLWAREGVRDSKRSEWGRAELVDWLAKHECGAELAARRLREAPAVLDGWLAALKAPPVGFTPDALREVLARLCPFDPARWPGEAPWFAHPSWPFARREGSGSWWRPAGDPSQVGAHLAESVSVAHCGWKTNVDWQALPGEMQDGIEGWRTRAFRQARYREATEHPTVRVDLSAVRRAPEDWRLPPSKLLRKPLKERITWTWLFGEVTGDALVVVRQERRGRSGMVEGGRCFTAVGSTQFQDYALRLVTETSRVPWERCLAEAIQPRRDA